MLDEMPRAMGWTFGLLVVRIAAALRLVPFFGGAPMPLLPWMGLSVTLGALIAPQVGPAPDAVQGAAHLLSLMLKELFLGLVIGAMVRIAFSVLEIVGQLAHILTFAIPEGREQGPLSTAYVLLGTGIFLLIGGHHALLTGLVSTTRCLPPHALPGVEVFAGATTEAVIVLFASAMATGVLAAAPIFAAALAADLTVGAVSRLYHGVAEAGAQTARLLVVQLMVVASLLLVVTTAVEFLQTGLEGIALCGK
jgi:flagellar biosynthetic protein FliR